MLFSVPKEPFQSEELIPNVLPVFQAAYDKYGNGFDMTDFIYTFELAEEYLSADQYATFSKAVDQYKSSIYYKDGYRLAHIFWIDYEKMLEDQTKYPEMEYSQITFSIANNNYSMGIVYQYEDWGEYPTRLSGDQFESTIDIEESMPCAILTK